ncbi:PspC domain-containing protein [Candidiatus Paracoxiella cheracis]|uniref:PspC domain-containing protein n=1 Tax=Candidiatus Paracoxiella cheracis TaxID=3405120 RepID=UPI003BF4EF56
MDIETPKKRLYRSRKERMIGGVCSGLADYFNIDPTWMRIIFVVLLIVAFSTFFAYIILWIIIPEEPIKTPSDSPPLGP